MMVLVHQAWTHWAAILIFWNSIFILRLEILFILIYFFITLFFKLRWRASLRRVNCLPPFLKGLLLIVYYMVRCLLQHLIEGFAHDYGVNVCLFRRLSFPHSHLTCVILLSHQILVILLFKNGRLVFSLRLPLHLVIFLFEVRAVLLFWFIL
jgi:hypothetical protein